MSEPSPDVHDVYIHVVDTGPLLRRLARIEVLVARVVRAVDPEGETMTEPTAPEPTTDEPVEAEDAPQETAGSGC